MTATAHDNSLATPDVARVHWPLLILAMAIFAGLSTWMAIASQGFLEADGITHYLSRRFALTQPLHMVGVWSRPVCVLLYALPSYFGGLLATRLMSLVLVLLMAWLAVDVARRLGLRRPELAGLFLLTQPLMFAHSFSELTEVPFALMLLAMFACYQRRWFASLAILATIAPAARPEGFGLLLVVAVALIAHRKFAWLLVLPAGIVIWSYAGWRVYGSTDWYPWWQWLRVNWPYSPQSMYGRGRPYYFLAILPAVAGPIAFPFVWLGVWASLRIQPLTKTFFTDHAVRCLALVAVVPLGVLVGHSVLWTLGKMASNGEPRYMLIVAPFWALLAAMGWQWLSGRFVTLRPGLLAVAGAAVPVMANLFYPAFPLNAQTDDRLAVMARDWMGRNEALRDRYPMFSAALPHLYMQFDLDRLDATRVVDSSRTVADHPPRGVLLMWDDVYSTHNSNEEYCITQAQLEANGWVPIETFTDEGRELIAYLSPLDRDGASPRKGVTK